MENQTRWFITKQTKGERIQNVQKNEVWKIYQNALSEYPDITDNDMMKIVSERTGVGLVRVQHIVAEFKSGKSASSSPVKENMSIKILSDFDKDRIRQMVHTLWYNREYPTLQKVLKTVANDETLCTLKLTSIYKILMELQFVFTTKKMNCILMDKLVIWRHKYLKDIKNYREEGRTIYYLGETWYNINNELSLQTNDYKRGVPLMAAYIGSNMGFVDDSLMIFQPKIKNINYQQEFESDLFFAWFIRVLPLLDDNSVIVMNDIQYHHYFKKEKFPTVMWKKKKIIQWFESKNIAIDTDDIEFKATLLKKAKLYRKENEKCMVEEHAKAQNKTVLRLPPYHTALNPIELVWPMIKGLLTDSFVANTNQFNKYTFVNAIGRITPKDWSTCIEHIEAEEQVFWDINRNIEDMMDKIDTSIYGIVNLSSDSDE